MRLKTSFWKIQSASKWPQSPWGYILDAGYRTGILCVVFFWLSLVLVSYTCKRWQNCDKWCSMQHTFTLCMSKYFANQMDNPGELSSGSYPLCPEQRRHVTTEFDYKCRPKYYSYRSLVWHLRDFYSAIMMPAQGGRLGTMCCYHTICRLLGREKYADGDSHICKRNQESWCWNPSLPSRVDRKVCVNSSCSELNETGVSHMLILLRLSKVAI